MVYWFQCISSYENWKRLSHQVHVLIYDIKFYSLRVRNKVLISFKFNLSIFVFLTEIIMNGLANSRGALPVY